MVSSFSRASRRHGVSLDINAPPIGGVGWSYSYDSADISTPGRRVGRGQTSTGQGAWRAVPSGRLEAAERDTLLDCAPGGRNQCVFFKGYQINSRKTLLTLSKKTPVLVRVMNKISESERRKSGSTVVGSFTKDISPTSRARGTIRKAQPIDRSEDTMTAQSSPDLKSDELELSRVPEVDEVSASSPILNNRLIIHQACSSSFRDSERFFVVSGVLTKQHCANPANDANGIYSTLTLKLRSYMMKTGKQYIVTLVVI
jgi:hypothetical protein